MASGQNMQMSEATYGGFINFVKWGSAVVILVAAIVITLIA